MKIGIICAMDSEHRQLAERLQQKEEWNEGLLHCVGGQAGGNELLLARCGIGKVNAALGAAELIRRFSPHCLVSTGVAGGLDASLRVGDVVAGAEVAYHDVWCGEGNAWGQVQGLPAVFPGHGTLLRHALRLDGTGGGIRVRAGLVCTGDQFITGRPGLEAIKARFPGALAVDMESAALAHTCHLCGVPFLTLRIVSDTPGATGDHAAQYAGFWDNLARRSFQSTWQFVSTLPGRLED